MVVVHFHAVAVPRKEQLRQDRAFIGRCRLYQTPTGKLEQLTTEKLFILNYTKYIDNSSFKGILS